MYDSIFTSHQLHALSTLLLVDIDDAATEDFVTFVTSLHAMGRLNRLMLDEAHLLFIARHYRLRIEVINQLRRVLCPFVCMTATLPPFVERKLRNLLHFTQSKCVRAGNDRSNLQYCVQIVSELNDNRFKTDQLLNEAVRICMHDMQS